MKKKLLLFIVLSTILNKSMAQYRPNPAQEDGNEHINLDVYCNLKDSALNYGALGNGIVNINDDFSWGIQISNDIEDTKETCSGYITGIWRVPITEASRLNIGVSAGLKNKTENQQDIISHDFLFELYYKEKNWNIDALINKEKYSKVSSYFSCDGIIQLTDFSSLEGKFDATKTYGEPVKFSVGATTKFELYPNKTSAKIQLEMKDWSIKNLSNVSFSTSATTKLYNNSITAEYGQDIKNPYNPYISVSDEFGITKAMKLKAEVGYKVKEASDPNPKDSGPTCTLTLSCGITK